MTHLVYPGALHTRFHHALGAMHLMSLAIETLRNKGNEINDLEEEAVIVAILLHDIGHGPFSHALEETIVVGITHEDISVMLMNRLNQQFEGALTTASQLDMDRMDYLNRDSFFTGVSEGVISSDRIIKMLNVKNDHIVVEEKGIYSIEKFLIARRLMYWQVYLHKTVIAAEQLLAKILKRSRELALNGQPILTMPALNHFLKKPLTEIEFMDDEDHLEIFAKLDDTDIMAAVKLWAEHEDFILSKLCRDLIERKLYKVEISNELPDNAFMMRLNLAAQKKYNLTGNEASYFVFSETIRNDAYKSGDGNIQILMKNGSIKDIADASDNSNLGALAKTVKKYILCYEKELV